LRSTGLRAYSGWPSPDAGDRVIAQAPAIGDRPSRDHADGAVDVLTSTNAKSCEPEGLQHLTAQL
jgi:hypothetical protein